jgi:hypothetical protein
MATNVRGMAEQVGDSASLALLARAGLIAWGVVHLLIGWLALQLAQGLSSGESADSSGALRTLAEQRFGKILLGLVAVGMVALALWQASEAIWNHRDRSAAKRVRKQVRSWAKAVFYAALGVSAALVALGSRAWSSQSQQQSTSGVMAWPGGPLIVAVTGLIIIGVGVAGVVKGVTKSFREEIDTSSMSPLARKVVALLGQVGYIAKGAALGVVGGLLSYAALTFERRNAQGMDAALQTILAQPSGKLALTAVAFGFAAFGLFAILQSRYRRM